MTEDVAIQMIRNRLYYRMLRRKIAKRALLCTVTLLLALSVLLLTTWRHA